MRQLISLLMLALISVSMPLSAQLNPMLSNSSSQPNVAPLRDELFKNNKLATVLEGEQNRFVNVEEAFPFNYYQQGNRLYIDWQIKTGYYLYQQQLDFEHNAIQIDEKIMRTGEIYNDEFFGDVNIYTSPLSVELLLSHYQPGAQITVRYQGCAKAGFCYPPEFKVISLHPFNEADKSSPTSKNQATINTPEIPSLLQHWWSPLLFLILGIGLAFTPCVFPMYPILTGLVLGQGKRTPYKTFLLSLLYVQGMALTYTLLGLVVASAGMQFQAMMQHPYLLLTLSLIFVLLALSMFGCYTLQLPSKIQTWLTQLSNKQQNGHGLGVFIMGAISGLICSPCTTAPLSGILLYVAQTGDLVIGAITLYALAIGMGAPLIIVAVFGNQFLPKTGEWMNRIKTLFGFILLSAPLFLLGRIIPESWSILFWSLLGISTFAWLYHCHNVTLTKNWKDSLLGIIAILGLLISAQPLLDLPILTRSLSQPNTEQMSSPLNTSSSVNFIRINDKAELEQQLQLAQKAGKAVMLDFYADWCVACKEFEKYTFQHPDVAKQLENMVLLQADVTQNRPQDIELLQSLNVLGLPTIEFWDQQGGNLPSARITGFMKAEPFLAHLQQLFPPK